MIKYLKRLLPSSLFYRFLLIILVPLILSQLAVSYFFYVRHWQQVQNRMVFSLCQEIIYGVHSFDKFGILPDENYPIKVENTAWPEKIKKRHQKASPIRLLSQCVHEHLNTDVIFNYTRDKKVEAYIKQSNSIIKFTFSQSRIESSSTIVFIFWLILVSAIFYALAIIFSRNQISPITNLAKVMEKFGKGQKSSELTPKGAHEVRVVTIAFNKMIKRIEKFITQRTLMLAGISHDLRTPLTRIKLSLAMLENKKGESIANDVKEMEEMINSYLDFTRNEEESTEKVEIAGYMLDLLKIKTKLKIETNIIPCIIELRKNIFKRVIKNILSNTEEYATKLLVQSFIIKDYYIIEFDDNGPGVEEKNLKQIFNPFFRGDNSRHSTNKTAHTGLGLSISKDIILSHGGNIIAEKSSLLGGLKIVISLPK